MVALQRVLQRRHERLPVAGHGGYAAAVDVDVLEDEDRGHATRERRRPAREVPLVRRFRRVALEERDRPAVGEELELQDVRVRKFGGYATRAPSAPEGVEGSIGFAAINRSTPRIRESCSRAVNIYQRSNVWTPRGTTSGAIYCWLRSRANSCGV